MTPLASRTVLLVEDDADDERLSLRALRRCGLPLEVRVARDGEQALRALGLGGGEEAPWVPDLVVSDLKMPKLGGDEALGRVRADAALRSVPYVVFTSSDEPRDARRCLELGASEFATKPIDIGEYDALVADFVRRWLTGTQLYSTLT